jgi:hypothetical protein
MKRKTSVAAVAPTEAANHGFDVSNQPAIRIGTANDA